MTGLVLTGSVLMEIDPELRHLALADSADVEGSDPGPVSLIGSNVFLAPIQPSDHQFLYWLANCEEIAYRWRFRGVVLPFEAFVQQLNANVFAQFVVRTRGANEPVGHVVAYAPDLRNRHVYVGNISAPEKIGSHLGAEAQIILINYLFALWDFNKIYVEVPEFSFARLRSWVSDDFFVIEGCLREHTYYKNRLWDQYLLALYRSRWVALAPTDPRIPGVAEL
jgi:RimJ/RimL family protein N-acetyltransferase